MSFNSNNSCVFDDPKNVVGVPRQESTDKRIIVSETIETADKLEVIVYCVQKRSTGITKSAKKFFFKMYDEETPHLYNELNIDIPLWMYEIQGSSDFYKNPLNQLAHPFISTSTGKEYVGKNIWFIDESKIWAKIDQIWVHVDIEWLHRMQFTGDHRLSGLIDEWKMFDNLNSN